MNELVKTSVLGGLIAGFEEKESRSSGNSGLLL